MFAIISEYLHVMSKYILSINTTTRSSLANQSQMKVYNEDIKSSFDDGAKISQNRAEKNDEFANVIDVLVKNDNSGAFKYVKKLFMNIFMSKNDQEFLYRSAKVLLRNENTSMIDTIIEQNESGFKDDSPKKKIITGKRRRGRNKKDTANESSEEMSVSRDTESFGNSTTLEPLSAEEEKKRSEMLIKHKLAAFDEDYAVAHPTLILE